MTSDSGNSAIHPHYNHIVLCILDGWGERQPASDNAISCANTPHWDQLAASPQRTSLRADGEAIGLPDGQFGNSEIGHMSIGCGRKLLLDLPRINSATQSGSFQQLATWQSLLAMIKNNSNRLHLMALLSDGGVHGDWRHLPPLISCLLQQQVEIELHFFADGRDTAPTSMEKYLQQFLQRFPDLQPASIAGRYFAMDRDQNWARTERYFRTVRSPADASGYRDARAYIKHAYQHGQSDEFIEPASRQGYRGMQAGDSILITNFRADRARQLLQLVTELHRGNSPDLLPPRLAAIASFTDYGSMFQDRVVTIFPPQARDNPLGEVLAKQQLSQLRLAETEKYAHVTYFFNGSREQPYPGEDRCLVPSPKVATYDLKPEMSAAQVCQHLITAIKKRQHNFIVVNFANPDMVGHTGKLSAAIQAVAAVDACLGRIIPAIAANNYLGLVTADHGNCEMMWDEKNQQPHTAHTLSTVPFIATGAHSDRLKFNTGSLADIAPTILQLMGLTKPPEMTGRSLLAL